MKPIVIFDIEASCEDKNINPRYNMETIEIGAVKILNNTIIDTFQILIKPEYINKLTLFCEELTGLTFEDLVNQENFNVAILHFYDFIKDSKTIYSCGDFDRKFLIKELQEKGNLYEHTLTQNAINSKHKDLKKYYTQVTNNKKTGMLGMAEMLDIQLTGNFHRGLDDALNLTKIFFKLNEIKNDIIKKQFTDKIMNNLISSLNHYHKNIYDITKNNDIYIIYDKLTEKTSEHNMLEFLELWSEAIAVDIEIKKLNYLQKNQIDIIKKYFL